MASGILGSASEAEDVMQETWLRLHGTDASRIENLEAWSVTTTYRICLNLLRRRRARAELPLAVVQAAGDAVPDRLPFPAAAIDPQEQVVFDEQVRAALGLVVGLLSPAERTAFLLHECFGVPYERIGHMLGRSPEAARQLGSRGRRRIGAFVEDSHPSALERGSPAHPAVARSFRAAARGGDIDSLARLLREGPGAGRRPLSAC